MNSKQRRKANRQSSPMKTNKTPHSAERAFQIVSAGYDQASRSVDVSLSSEQPVNQPFGREVLRHTPDAIDMSRAANGLPLLLNHDRSALPAGRITNIRLDGGKLRGTIKIDESRDDIAGLVARGVLVDTSISYSIDDYEQDRTTGDITVTRWQPREGSLVSVPADPTVGAGRTIHDEDLPMEKQKIVDDALSAERARAAAINELFTDCDAPGVQALWGRALAEGMSEADAARELVKLVTAKPASGQEPVAMQRGTASAGADESDKFRSGAFEALMIRMGKETDREKISKNEFSSYSMLELARHDLKLRGVSVRGLSPADVVSRAISPGTAGATVATFPDVFENALNKTLYDGFAEYPRTWDRWCSVGSTPDFRTFTRPGLSHFQDLAVVAENAAFTAGVFNDKKESATPQKFGRIFSLTREAILADDLSAFSTTSNRMGQAAARAVDKAPYDLLIANAVMVEDGLALFVAGHNNLSPGGAAVPTVASVEAAATAMRKQTDQNSIKLGINPVYILGPVDLAFTITKLTEAEYDPAGTAGTLTPNSVRGMGITPVITPHLTDASDWFLAGPKGGTVEMVFVGGQQEPRIERDQGWEVDAMHWKVAIEFAAIDLDWRALVKNVGV